MMCRKYVEEWRNRHQAVAEVSVEQLVQLHRGPDAVRGP